MKDINPLIKEVCQEHIKKVHTPKVKLKVVSNKVTNSDPKFLQVALASKIKKNNLDEVDTENNLDNFSRE